VTSFVGVPVADAGVPGDAGKPVVQPVAGVGVAEDEVAVVPGLAGASRSAACIFLCAWRAATVCWGSLSVRRELGLGVAATAG
jgi:hypothetical protein